MGLDWMLQKMKPREGSETRFAEIELALKDAEEKAETREEFEELSKDLGEELNSISVSAFDVIGAPRLGRDKRADDWFFENVYKSNHQQALEERASGGDSEWSQLWSKPFDAVVESFEGRYIVEAAEDKRGLAHVSGIVASAVDFRGKMLRFCEGLSEALIEESYEDHTAAESLAYADRLEEASSKVLDEEDRSIVGFAVTWLRFWGQRGFGYRAWY